MLGAHAIYQFGVENALIIMGTLVFMFEQYKIQVHVEGVGPHVIMPWYFGAPFLLPSPCLGALHFGCDGGPSGQVGDFYLLLQVQGV